MADAPTPAEELFVGRAYELDQLRAMRSAAALGKGSVAFVRGDPGVGKTRFCDEVARQARVDGHRVVVERCWIGGGAPALWPWQSILRELCGGNAAGLLRSAAGPRTGSEAVDAERFAAFTAVTDRLAASCTGSPACLIIDDIQLEGTETLLLTLFVARAVHRLPLTLVLSCGVGVPPGDRPDARLLQALEAEATLVLLHRFDEDESATFLAHHGLGDLASDLKQAVLRLSRGNPLQLRRIAALASREPGSLPDHLHIAVDEALVGLDEDTQRILCTSAVLGPTPYVTEAAALAETDAAAVLEAVGQGSSVGVTASLDDDRFTFTHELVRSVLEDGLPLAERLDAHARAARTIAAGDRSTVEPTVLARQAHHARAAAPRSLEDARAAVSACLEAARSSMAGFAYEQAEALLTSALALHGQPPLGPPSAELLVEWAQAALMCGRLADARDRFGRAARAADPDTEPILLAEAALGLGGHWVNEHRAPIERARVLGLQRSARDRLPEGQATLRCRLDARLAAEAVYDGGPVKPMLDALDAARRCGDPGALAEALSLCHHTLLTPAFNRSRLALADELIRVASEAGHGVLALMGLCWRAVDLFLLGDVRASHALEDLRQATEAVACQNVLYIVGVLDVMLLMRQGRFDEAETQAARCFELGNAAGEVDTLAYLGAHLLVIRWAQGREAELLEMATEMAESPPLVENEFAFRAAAGVVAAAAGDRDRARAALVQVAGDGLASLPRSSTWMIGMATIVDLAAILEDASIAREAYDLLLPFADWPVMGSLAVVCLGSAERPLGIAARTFGDLDRAVGHLERAVEANRLLANRPLVAICQAELATALGRRGGADDRDRAADLLDEALREADAMGMTQRAAAWRTRRTELVPAGLPADRTEPDAGGGPGTGSRRGVLRREGRGWFIAVDGHGVFVRHRVGITYLAELLSRPGQAVESTTLVGGPVEGDGGWHELLDDRARAAYAQRVLELRSDVDEARANADIGRAERLQLELDALVDEIGAAIGLGGQPRRFADTAERARSSVRKAIKRAIDEIDAAAPAIGALLRSSVMTGSVCMYRPDRRAVLAWKIETGPTTTDEPAS